jgi:hypothetical protein
MYPMACGSCTWADRVDPQVRNLFKRLPAYAVFRHKASDWRLVVCSVHLASNPSDELRYTCDLLPREPQVNHGANALSPYSIHFD